MTIAYRQSTLSGSVSSPAAISSTGVVDGDRLFAHVRLVDNIAPTSLPSGFTLVPGAEVAAGGGIRVYTKVAGPSEPATYDFTWASGTGRIAITAVYSDDGLETQIDDVSANSDTGTVATWDEVTCLVNDSFLLAFYSGSASQNPSADPAMTKRYDLAGTNPIFLMTQGGVALGATGARNITVTSSNHRLVMIAVSEIPLDIPETPTGLSATPASSSSIALAWNDESDNETSFTIERSLDGSTGWTEVLTPAANAETATDTGLDPETEYFYRIAAVGDDGTSDWSEVESATTPASPAAESQGYHIYFDIPTVVFKARVNLASASYPLLVLPFDTVTVGAYGDLIPDMTLLLGTTEGADDLGRVRVHNFATSTYIPVGRISHGEGDGTLSVQDNAYITVLDDYRVWSKIPRMIIDPETDEDITTFKDADIPVLSYNDEIPPVANSGPFFADYVNGDGEITVTFPMEGVNLSVPMAEGATITDYDWDIVDGTLTGGALTDASITATFPAGRRWVGLTVTDSNGKVHTTRTFVLAVDPEDDTTYKDWANANFTMTKQGQVLDVTLNAPLPRNTYLDGCLVLVWKDAPSTPGDRSHMKFCGWQQTEQWSVGGSERGLTKSTTVKCGDIGIRLSELPGFPQALERPTDEDPAWEYMPDLTMNRALNYLGAWHTTAWSLADIIFPEDDDYPTLRLDTGADNIFDQLSSTAKKMLPSHILTCTPQGQLTFILDWMEVDTGDRPAGAYIFLEENIADISVQYNRQPKAHSLHVGAIQTSEDWVIIGGEKDLSLLFSIAPGDAFGQGVSEVVQSQGLCQDQETINKVAGHRFARINSRYDPFRVGLADSFDFWELAPALMLRTQLNIGEDYAAQRGLDFTSAFGMLESMNVRVLNGKRGYTHNVSFAWEKEVSGPPGIMHIPEEVGESEYNPPPPIVTDPPPVPGAGISKMAGIGIDGYRYRTFDLQEATPTWERHDLSLANAYSWTVDPFSPGYISSSGPVNGWVAKDNGIYYVEDLFGTTSATLIHTFDVATDHTDFHWRTIQASFGAFFGVGFNPWLLCVSYYHDTSGHEGTWAKYSTDRGATWSTEVQISQHHIAGALTEFSPIAVWTSPRTPGKAYTVAYLEDSLTTSAFVTTNWGASWTETETIDPGYGMAGTIHVPWDSNLAENVILFGYQGPGGATDESLLPIVAVIKDGAVYAADTIGLTHEQTITSGGAGIITEGPDAIIFAPPTNAVRMVVTGSWTESRVRTGGLSSGYDGNLSSVIGSNFPNATPSGPTLTKITGAPVNGSITEDFTLVWVRNGGETDWNNSVDDFEATPPTTSANYCRLSMDVLVNASPGTLAIETLTVRVTITEIELEDGTIYSPSAGNREFKLKRAGSGGIVDISPNDGTRFLGVRRGPFGVRAFDGAGGQQYLLAAVVGNDETGSKDDDLHALYISSTAGASWTEVIAPFANSEAPTGRPALEAAFSGDNHEVFYVWGPPEYFGYSDDFGATVQDKSGNLGALGLNGFIGIAGVSS